MALPGIADHWSVPTHWSPILAAEDRDEFIVEYRRLVF
jgi:hypothetical protein